MKMNIIGQRYGSLVVVSEAEPLVAASGHRYRRLNCLCDCGNYKIALYSNLASGKVRSCGCYRLSDKYRMNLVGQRFGRLTVLAEGEPRLIGSKPHRTWICRCECGSEKQYSQNALTNKIRGTQSCGCTRTVGVEKHTNLTGNRYGSLTVLRKASKPDTKSSNGNQYWECVCNCGKTKIITQNNLLSGHTRSCGCLRWQMKRGDRFGKLTLLSHAPEKHSQRYWNVRCDYGMVHTVSIDVLFRAANVYCACGSNKPRIDLTGQVFGRLTALMEVDPVKNSGGRNIPSWLCRCTCGKEVVVRRKNLLRKTTRSCGCLRRTAAKQFDPMPKR